MYRLQGRFERADPLYARAIVLLAAKSSRADENLVLYQENHASLLRELDRGAEAIELEARAAAIRARLAD